MKQQGNVQQEIQKMTWMAMALLLFAATTVVVVDADELEVNAKNVVIHEPLQEMGIQLDDDVIIIGPVGGDPPDRRDDDWTEGEGTLGMFANWVRSLTLMFALR